MLSINCFGLPNDSKTKPKHTHTYTGTHAHTHARTHARTRVPAPSTSCTFKAPNLTNRAAVRHNNCCFLYKNNELMFKHKGEKWAALPPVTPAFLPRLPKSLHKPALPGLPFRPPARPARHPARPAQHVFVGYCRRVTRN